MELKGFHLSRATILIIILIGLLGVSLSLNYYQVKKRPQLQKMAIEVKKALAEVPKEPADASSEISGHWYGLCPKNSIHSIDDFRQIVAKDPLLAKHFSGFNWEKARMGRHPQPIWTHLTYRKNERIRTTRKVIKLPAGDGFITDGDRWVRTYCGNDYVLANSPEPAAAPPTEKIDADLNRLLDRSDSTFRLKEDGSLVEEEDLLAVPEPGSLALLSIGVACFSLYSFLSLRGKNRRRRSRAERIL